MKVSRDNISQAVGVFDSGIGGLTVVQALRQVLPGEDIIYLGDTARVPYGTKSAATVIRYSRQTTAFLYGKGIKYLVVACNTASAHSIAVLRQEMPIPVMGVIEPGARMGAASTQMGQLGVIGTLGTIESGAYHRALHAINPLLTVFGQACPLLVPLAEEGWLDHPVTAQVARHYLTELRMSAGDLDTIVLGCTHYPLLKKTLSAEAHVVFGHSVQFIDSALAVSQTVAQDMQKHDLLRDPEHNGTDQFYFTDVSRFAEIAARFLGSDLLIPLTADL